MGAECLIELLSRIDLKELSFELRHKAHTETSKQRKTEALKRLLDPSGRTRRILPTIVSAATHLPC
mgnify:CR=1 FL=1